MKSYDCIIIGSGPAGLGAAFHIIAARPEVKILIIEKAASSTGGLRNDCKMNFTFPIGFPRDVWDKEDAERYLCEVERILKPSIMEKHNVGTYLKRAERLGVQLLDIRQAHLGTDGGIKLIKQLTDDLTSRGVEILLRTEVREVEPLKNKVITDAGEYEYRNLAAAPGRGGFRFLQSLMDKLGVEYIDHIVDIGLRIETRLSRYPIVKDYYDPKFIFPDNVRTFCTNSGGAYVVRERYRSASGTAYYSVNGHAYAAPEKRNNLVNFAMLKTVRLTEPLASGQDYAEMLGLQAMLLGGGNPIMQRIGDFRLGKRSKIDSFSEDLYDFEPTLLSATPGDISLAIPARILRAVWKSLKMLDTIIPGILHPATIMYYPEIKLYANKPVFTGHNFGVGDDVYMIGDGAGTSRGITAAWASGVRAAEGILNNL